MSRGERRAAHQDADQMLHPSSTLLFCSAHPLAWAADNHFTFRGVSQVWATAVSLQLLMGKTEHGRFILCSIHSARPAIAPCLFSHLWETIYRCTFSTGAWKRDWFRHYDQCPLTCEYVCPWLSGCKHIAGDHNLQCRLQSLALLSSIPIDLKQRRHRPQITTFYAGDAETNALCRNSIC